MNKAIIQFIDFTFKYRTQKTPTLKHINLTIYEGEKVLIVGPSGSGKSTLGHCINGLVPNSYEGEITGSVMVADKNPLKEGIFALSEKVGTVMQDTDSQFIGLTVAEDIAFSLENNCVPVEEMKKIVRDCAKLVGVEELLSHAPSELSGGQKQRVSIGGVMTEDAQILLFDEPLANLDPATGKYAIELIDQIHQDTKKTIVIIEHRLEDVLHRGIDRIIVMGDGEVLADMSPDEILCTEIFRDNGIREPLYIAALKYAGEALEANNRPSDLEQMPLKSYQQAVKQWFQNIDLKEYHHTGELLLTLEDVNFAYEEGFPILQKIGFQLYKGEMISIVGKNGAGKTTLSKLICGFIHPDQGILRYKNEDMRTMTIPQRARHIGLVMQNPNQMISKPMIFDEVALGLRTRQVPEEKVKDQVEEILRICGLYQYRNWPISALSYGQKKRVTIASILVLEPEILILDEPTAGQDYKHYTEIMNFLQELNKKLGITIVMITHDMHLMLEYTNRTIVISEGVQLADTRPAKVLTTPDLVDSANLKVTSLYTLAQACGIEDTTNFAECFIQYDREVNRTWQNC